MTWLKRTITLGELLTTAFAVFTVMLGFVIHMEIKVATLQTTEDFHTQQLTDYNKAITSYEDMCERHNQDIDGKLNVIVDKIGIINVALENKENRK